MDSASSTSARKPSDTYVCKRCNVPGRAFPEPYYIAITIKLTETHLHGSGHWLPQCPTNLDPSFDAVPPRLQCPLCGAVGKHLKTLCPKNTDPNSINQQRILAGVSTKDHRRESRMERHKFRLSSNTSSKGEDNFSRRGDRGRSRVRGHERNLDQTGERSRSRSPRIRVRKGRTLSRRRDRSIMNHSRCTSPQHLPDTDDVKDEGPPDWEADYGLINADRARRMKSTTNGQPRRFKQPSFTQMAKTHTFSEYADHTSKHEEARRSTAVSPSHTYPMNDWCESLGSPDQQAGVLHMSIALRSRQPQQPDETVTNTDRILESVKQYIAAEFDREAASESNSLGPQDAPIIEPLIGTRHPLDSYSAAARGLIWRCGLSNPWVNYTKRTRALDLWDKKEQVPGASRARIIRP
ncbi:hypothetical protein M0657_007921 [Pyricularia oryzae]|uniref:Uncharacterized protein n=3 Tax=Pyricularia oryzae TaxID=318829 RepID=A0A4V1C5J5_PYROR|nr:hypothetical protein OOU_Y34scaffold00295g24 [Pyricularia oryzae Y34]KAI7917743.1 hypothetical protein M0657_007921 [Pyricularia oryzae]QBZ56605.1 hypothetical protein PoMZ_01515 [Pyricularia oryzae]